MNTCAKKGGGTPPLQTGFFDAAAEPDWQIAKLWRAELEWAGSDRQVLAMRHAANVAEMWPRRRYVEEFLFLACGAPAGGFCEFRASEPRTKSRTRPGAVAGRQWPSHGASRLCRLPCDDSGNKQRARPRGVDHGS